MSDIEYVKDDPDWNEIMVFHIQKTLAPPEGKALDFKELLFDPGNEFELFEDKDKWWAQLRGHTCRPLSESDFLIIQNALQEQKDLVEIVYRPHPLRTTRQARGAMSELVPLTEVGLLYEPVSEIGVVFLFSKHHRKLGYPYVLRIQREFPDATVLNDKGEPEKIEFEYKSSNFLKHGHDPKQCDAIVCWEDDTDEIPEKVKIVELKSALDEIFGR